MVLYELQTNLKSKKMIGLDEGGSVEVKTVDMPYQARLTKLELDEKNIYRFGMGLRTCTDRICVLIFEHNFSENKAIF